MKKTHKIISLVLVFMLVFSCISALPASAAVPDAPADPAPACPLLFHNTLQWENIYEYSWGNDGDVSDAWPGKKLSPIGKDDYGYDIYSLDIFVGSTGIVINDGKGQQTDDITDFQPEGGGYYLDAEKTVVNAYGTTVYEPLPLEASEIPTDPISIPGESGKLKFLNFSFTNSLNWDDVYVYMWDDNGNDTAEWPGMRLDIDRFNDQDEEVYQLCGYWKVTGIIFNDGKGLQTDEITDFYPEGDGYYLDAEKTVVNENGTNVYIPIPLGDKTTEATSEPATEPVTESATEPATEPTSEPATEPATEPNEYPESYTIGDADGNKTININDVTAIQKYLAKAPVPDTFNVYAADVDQNDEVTINDATLVQYFLAGMDHKDSYCNTEKVGKLSGKEYSLYFTDRFNWGKVSLIARDVKGRLLPNTTVEKHFYEGIYYFSIPVETAYLIVVSEDGTKQTAPFTDYRLWDYDRYSNYFVAWDKNNNQYVLDMFVWGGLMPIFTFVNTLGWEHVYMEGFDKYGNITDYEELTPLGFSYLASPSNYAEKIVISDGKGHKTDYITDFYGLPDNHKTYYPDKTKTTVNDEGETVYVPVSGFPEDGYGTFKFVNTLGWDDIYAIYDYNDHHNSGVAECTKDGLNENGHMVYTITVPFCAEGIYIAGKGGQTDCITDFNPSGGGYYVVASRTVIDEIFGSILYVPLTLDSYPKYEGSFYFTNSLGWEDLHIYVYNDEGDVTAAWPGDKLTDFYLNDYGVKIYLVKIPKGAVGIVISGKGGQTDNITNFNPDGGSYYLDKNKTTINEFGATVYMPMQW